MIGAKDINTLECIDIRKVDSMSGINISNEDERIVAGWVSVEVKDLQGDVIPIDEIEKAMYKLMDRGGGIFYGHSNKPVGKILRWEVKENPETGKLGVYIVAKIFKDYKIDDIVWEKVKKGEIKGFSVGGNGKQKTVIMKDDDGIERSVRVLTDIELCEISLVERPANPYAKIDYVNTIAKSIDTLVKGVDGNWYVVDDNGEFLAIGEYEVMKMTEDGWKDFVMDMIKRLNLADIPVSDVWLDKSRKDAEDIVSELYSEVAERIYGKDAKELKPDEVYVVKRVAELIKDAIVLYAVSRLRERWFGSGLDFDKLTRQLSFEFDHENQILKAMVEFYNDVLAAKSEEEIAKAAVVAINKVRDLRPPKKWIDHCIKRVMEEQGLDRESAARLCGWTFYHNLNPVKPEDKKDKDKERTRAARARKRAWVRNVVEAKKMLDEVIDMSKGKKDDSACKSRYVDENGRFKRMTSPDDPKGKKTRFGGCVRYFMNCRGMSLDQAKRMCGYIARYVKKG